MPPCPRTYQYHSHRFHLEASWKNDLYFIGSSFSYSNFKTKQNKRRAGDYYEPVTLPKVAQPQMLAFPLPPSCMHAFLHAFIQSFNKHLCTENSKTTKAQPLPSRSSLQTHGAAKLILRLLWNYAEDHVHRYPPIIGSSILWTRLEQRTFLGSYRLSTQTQETGL